MKHFNVTFTDSSNKYSPTTRTIRVDADSSYQAELLIHSQFGTFKKADGVDGLKGMIIPSEKHIKIVKTKEIKPSKKKE